MSAQLALVERTRDAIDVRLESSCGRIIDLPVARWWSPPPPEETSLLDLAMSATLDVGCGPGRHVIELERRGVTAVGIDNAGGAVAAARRRGARVMHRSIFDPVPGEGAWGTALLIDGNVGIGGDPERLLMRCRQLLRPAGRALLEVEAPGEPTEALRVRATWEDDRTDWFAWARVSADHTESLARACGFVADAIWGEGGRWFAHLDVR